MPGRWPGIFLRDGLTRAIRGDAIAPMLETAASRNWNAGRNSLERDGRSEAGKLSRAALGGAKPVLAGEIGLTGGLGRIHEVVAYAARHHQITRYDPQLAAFCGFAFYDVAGTDREPRREPRLLHSHDEFSVANLAGINLPEPVLPE